MIEEHELYFLLYGALALFVLGIILSLLAKANRNGDDLARKLEKALPGVQCAQCGYPGCKAYAQAMASGQAACNLCPPGGQDTIDNLAAILGVAVPMDENEDAIFAPRTVAIIHQSLCTGCTKCTRHCPVDAIEGTVREPHSIIEHECIGCSDCVKVCPERCIEMIRLEPTLDNFNWEIRTVRVKNTNS